MRRGEDSSFRFPKHFLLDACTVQSARCLNSSNLLCSAASGVRLIPTLGLNMKNQCADFNEKAVTCDGPLGKSQLSKLALFMCALAMTSKVHAQLPVPTNMDKVYADESHCLVGPEVRSDKDSPISCYCRDAIVDARYVYFTYLLTGKDTNLNGTFLTLQRDATESCGRRFDVDKMTTAKSWKWNGPEVVRIYPPDSEIKRINPDSYGTRRVKYEVRLVERNRDGRATTLESFSATELLPPSAVAR